MGIFSTFAPKYWEAKIPVMPLKKRSKAPILNEWQTYGKVFPSEAIRNHWLDAYPDSNIGLPLGEASGLVMIDIDTDDEALTEAIMDCLPASPWKRVGKKGCALVFRWEGQKNFKIRSDDGMICEFLGQGNQLVMPGSIHPDTGLPYISNVDLWDVMDKVQPLGMDIEARLREALGAGKGVKLAHEGRSAPMVVVPQGERDIQLVRHAGYLARVVQGIDKNSKFSLAEAMGHMHTWVTDYTKGVSGDDMDPEKGVAKLLEFLLKDVEAGKVLPDGWDSGLTASQLEHPSIVAMLKSNEIARWTPSRARAWLSENCELKPDDVDWAVAKIEELVQLLATDDQFTEFQLESLQKDFAAWAGKGTLAKPSLKKLFKDTRDGLGEVEETDDDHEAIALRVLEMISRDGELRFSNGSFWQWSGSCFKQLEFNEIYKRVSRIKGNNLSKRHSDYKAIVAVVGILASKELLEAGALGVNFANGFLDIDGELHPHSPTFGQTHTMPFNYVPERAGECHKWLAFLEQVWGNDPDYGDKVAALQEAFAVTMFGNATQYHRAILLYGRAKTGKSTVLKVLKAMMPPAAVSSIVPQEWSKQFVMVKMVGKTLNVCGELSEMVPIDGPAFKSVVEGEVQTTEYKGQDKFDFKPVAAQWFASNFLPLSRDGSDGFLRRWLILYFGHPVSDADKVIDYHDVLVSEEREAIAAWAIQGMSRVLAKRDFTLPASHYEQLNSVRRSNNMVAAWLQDNRTVLVVPGEDIWADGTACHDHFKLYAKASVGYYGQIIAFERFRQMLEELGHNSKIVVDAIGQNHYHIKGLKNTSPLLPP
jgi:putative DNA primase/helicase